MRLISFFDHEQVNLKTRKLSKYAKKTEEINESYFGMEFFLNLKLDTFVRNNFDSITFARKKQIFVS
jgi:hypothetical protein